jgi:hypothetical protein
MRMQARQVEYAISAAPPGKSPPVYPCNSRSDASSDACRYAACLLYWYKSTNTDAMEGCPARLVLPSGAQFACFTGTKVQTLTQCGNADTDLPDTYACALLEPVMEP